MEYLLAIVLYSSKDSREAEHVYALSRTFGNTFIASNLTPGEQWREAIARKICEADIVLVVWSKNAAQSKEVDKELHIATICDRKIVPVLLDYEPLPPLISSWHAVNWR